MRGTEQKNGREFVLGRRRTSDYGGGGEGMRDRVRGIPVPREKGGIYRRNRVIGDSLFLLAFPSRVLSFNSLDRFIDYVQLIIRSYVSTFLRHSSIFRAAHLDGLTQGIFRNVSK